MTSNEIKLLEKEEVAEKNKIKTSCRFCEFSVKDETNSQVSCELNLLNRYRNKGVKIEITDFDDKHGKGKCHQLETFCIFRRPPGWKKAKEEEAKDKGFEQVAKDELVVDTTFIVYLPPKTDFEVVKQFTQTVNQMTVKPKKLMFINYAGISPLLFPRLNAETNIEWGMEFMLNANSVTDINELRKKANDFGIRKVKTNFVVTLDVDKPPKTNFIEHIRNTLVDDLESIFVVLDDEGQANLYQTMIYKHVNGNEQINVNEKIRLLAEDNKCLHLIKTTQEIFPK